MIDLRCGEVLEYPQVIFNNQLRKDITLKKRTVLLIATWFYSGLIPPIIVNGMAGTYGSLFSIPLCYVALLAGKDFPSLYYGIMLLIFLLGMWSVPKAEVILGPRIDWKGKVRQKDQNQIVIDETFGMLVTCYPLTIIPAASYWLVLVLAFALFRVFDIVKVPPTKLFDRMDNAFGVMFDDAIAGLYAGGILALAVLVFKL